MNGRLGEQRPKALRAAVGEGRVEGGADPPMFQKLVTWHKQVAHFNALANRKLLSGRPINGIIEEMAALEHVIVADTAAWRSERGDLPTSKQMLDAERSIDAVLGTLTRLRVQLRPQIIIRPRQGDVQ